MTNRAYIPDNCNCFDLRNERFSIVTTLYVGGSDYNPDTASTSSSSALTLSATQSHGSSASHHGSGFKYDCTTCTRLAISLLGGLYFALLVGGDGDT